MIRLRDAAERDLKYLRAMPEKEEQGQSSEVDGLIGRRRDADGNGRDYVDGAGYGYRRQRWLT